MYRWKCDVLSPGDNLEGRWGRCALDGMEWKAVTDTVQVTNPNE